jgi:uncharacterized damage-inducible protein DinB
MDVNKAILSIQQTTDEIIGICEGLAHEALLWKPAEDKWSAMEVLCHLEEVIPYWLGELQSAVQSPQTPWGRGLQHEGRLAAVAVAHERDVSEVLHNLAHSKQLVQDVLGSLSEEELKLEAPSRNPRFGTKPLSFIVEHLLVEHVAKHLEQIRRSIDEFESAAHN